MTTSQSAEASAADLASADYAALVRAAVTGDRDAMERLLLKAQEAAYRFSLLVCGHPEDAEDVMQDALLKTYQYVNSIKDPEAFRPWLYTTVRNACLMKRRRHAGEPARLISVEQGTASGEGPGAPIDVADTARPADERMIDDALNVRIRKAIEKLLPASRAIVVMREIEGLSTREVATILGISEANVKTRLHRARAQLRRHLEGA